MSEIKRIMDYFGVSQIEGNVRGEHFSTILDLLKKNSGKRWKYLISIAPLHMGGMQQRYIKENYLDGFTEIGIIKMYQKNNVLYYQWFGESALNGSAPKEEKKEGCCPVCNKELETGKIFCNEKCLREYYNKNKSD